MLEFYPDGTNYQHHYLPKRLDEVCLNAEQSDMVVIGSQFMYTKLAESRNVQWLS